MSERAAALRDAFDRGFTLAAAPPAPGLRDFLCIQVAGQPSALPLADIASLHADLRIAALPTRAPELLGVAAIRAAIVPIYDLRIAFGAAGSEPTRWTVLVRGGAAGFAFAHYERHVRISDRAVAPAAQPGHLRGHIMLDGQPRAIVDLCSLLTAIETRWRPSGAAKGA